MTNIEKSEYTEIVQKVPSDHDLILYLENHGNYEVSRAVSAFIAFSMAFYMILVREDPLIFTTIICLGIFFFIVAVFDAVPLFMMERTFGVTMRERKETCPPLKDHIKSVSSYLAIGTFLLLAAAIIGLAMELPYI